MKNLRARFRAEQRIGQALALAAIGAAISADGQNAASSAPASTDFGLRTVLVSAGLASEPPLLPGGLIRVIEDPSLGGRWMLCRNADHPGGPGRLLLVSNQSAGKRNLPGNLPIANAPDGGLASVRPVIRAGDRVIVEEISAVAEARLAAVALESAAAGSAFKVRLEIGGKVLLVVAVRAGQALFQPRIEVRR
jgi:hypothetical protein